MLWYNHWYIYIPIQLSEETKKLYEDLKNKGYNLFDKNDKFYTDICTPYKTENGTDILLADRYNDFYIKINWIVKQIVNLKIIYLIRNI